tara:strand:+ start:576 stop:830 length:255 start_codon:yes stop_codon:yes gene_type:complete
MILINAIIIGYYFCTMTTAIDEAWNMTHPRPYPKQEYVLLNWEELDFYQDQGKWLIREFRESDNETKAYFRSKHYKGENIEQSR